MSFLLFLIAIIFFNFIYWHFIFVVVAAPSLPFIGLISWVFNEPNTKSKRFSVAPILIGAFIFGTLLPVLFYSAGIFSITSHFMESAAHPILYAVVGGLTCAFISAPSGESNVAGFYISVISYILFMTTMQVYGHAIAQVGMSLGGIVFAILIAFFILFAVVWLILSMTHVASKVGGKIQE